MNKIKEDLKFIFKLENIKSIEDLNNWCGTMGRKKLYSYIQHMSPIEWSKIKDPNAYVRYYYEKELSCNKIHLK